MRLFIIVGAMIALARPAAAAKRVALVTEGELAAPARHGLDKLEQALRRKGFEIAPTAGAPTADFIILAGVRSNSNGGAVETAIRSAKGALPEGAEALTVQRAVYRSRPAVVLYGADARGLMYAALDTADRVGWTTSPDDPFQQVHNTSEKAYLAERAISMYTMQRAYFESRLYD